VSAERSSAEAFLREFEDARPADPSYSLTLYVAGTTPRSARAIVNVRKLCEEYLFGRYKLQIVDITHQARTAIREQIVAVPMLVREFPLPSRRFIGDMSDKPRLLSGLEIGAA
jgi:circadian clock protein KaiB